MDAPETDKKSQTSHLRVVCIVGVILLCAVGGGLCFLLFYSGKSFFSRGDGNREAFYEGLYAFDTMLMESSTIEKPEVLNRALDKLEKNIFGVESYLSLLKRRRFLAQKDVRFISPYQKAAEAAAKAIPFSQALAAIAAEALLLEEPTLTEKTAEQLRDYAFHVTEARLKPLALSLYVLVGDMQDPLKAATIANKEAVFSTDLSFLETHKGTVDTEELQNRLAIDLAVLRILDGDIPGATGQINRMIQKPPASVRSEILNFAAEFFYDYDKPLKAAELFSQFSDEKSMTRQADALWLSGHIPSARNIWTTFVSSEESEHTNFLSESQAKSLYNLAATETDKTQEIAYLKRLVSQTTSESYYTYGMIRYTRLLDASQSIALLEKELFRKNPLLDLELLKRQGELWFLDKTVAETWLLVNRYPDDPRLYQWGCYFFDFQKRYDETDLLIESAGYRKIQGPWLEIHDSLRLVREDRVEEAEKKLASIAEQDTIWQVPANMGRIQEARQSFSAALHYYETAAALVKEKKAAAEIQLRISHCLRLLNREQESRQALEQAIQLNPDYPAARLELRRLNAQGNK